MSESDISGVATGPGNELEIADVEPSARVSGNSHREPERETRHNARRVRGQSPAPSAKSAEEVGGDKDANETDGDKSDKNSPQHQVDKLA